MKEMLGLTVLHEEMEDAENLSIEDTHHRTLQLKQGMGNGHSSWALPG